MTAPIDLRGMVTEMASSANRTWYIYCHTAPNGKRYIGQTCQEPEKRWKEGEGYKRVDTPHFYNAIQNYGWDNFEHVILCSCSSQEYADFLEQWFIKKYDTMNREKGYNLTAGGKGSARRVLSDESRAKMAAHNRTIEWTEDRRKKVSETLKRKFASGEIVRKPISEETREKLRIAHTGPRNHNYGKKRSAETRRRMSEAQMGRHPSEETRRKQSEAAMNSPKKKRCAVCQFTLDGEYIASYPSMMEAQRQTGILSASISCCCRGLSKTSGGYVWCLQAKPETFPSPAQGLFS